MGELQKKIGETPYKYRRGDNALIFDNSAISKADAYKIAEEMRREFPSNVLIEVITLYKNLKRHTEEEKQIIIREHLKNCNVERFILENIEWFEKWFGKPQK